MSPTTQRRRLRGRSHPILLRPCLEVLENRLLFAIPQVSAESPYNNGFGVGISAKVTATFTEPIDVASLGASSFDVRDAAGNPVAGSITYNPYNRTATFDADSPLQYSTTYTATLHQGAILSTTGDPLAADLSWSFTTASSPTVGAGGPILIVTSAANPFTSYYPEILRNEGLNAFATAELSTLTASNLAGYTTVILGQTSLDSAQATLFTDYVTNGGNLIAMRPDKQLASLFGITDTQSTLSNAYLLIDTSTSSGSGITNQTMQYHGGADLYTLSGASALATLYSSATAASPSPAVTLRSVGTLGGTAVAFTYDLAKSIVYTRQGNPDWAGQDRDGLAPIRSDDLFFGNASFDPQPDWVDLNKVSIPQADEQQRLLANIIQQVSLADIPLPRFWYLPNGAKAAVLMTGDDHAVGGTAGRFDSYIAANPANASVENWQTIRSSSYGYPNSPLTNDQAAFYTSLGFEFGVHVTTNLQDFTSPSDLDNYYTTQLAQWRANYPSIPTPSTHRMHAIVWSDYTSEASVELAHRMRLDLNYYSWPPSWIQNRPGLFTGSAMPMRFADATGQTIDNYQAVTQMTDESNQTYPYTVNALLDKATGAEGYYGVYTANMHTDFIDSSGSDAIIASAKAHNVPVVSGEQMLNWLDGRNGSTFANLAWNASSRTLNFDVNVAVGATGLQGMVPLRGSGNLRLASLQSAGLNVAYTVQTIKGIEYAFFNAAAGAYSASYAPDTTPPAISAASVTIPTSSSATISWTTDELADSYIVFGTSPTSLNQTAGSAEHSLSHSIQLTGLSPVTTIYYRILSTDPSGNKATSPSATSTPSSFTTPATLPTYSLWPTYTIPAFDSWDDPTAAQSGIELGVQFTADAAGYITGIRFYKSAANTGTHIGNLWTASGTLLGSATFTSESAVGWQTVTFSSPIAVQPNQVYVASYHTNTGFYAGDPAYFTAPLNSGNLHALAGANGVYGYGPSSFPSQSYNSTNYWVDVIYSTSPAPVVWSDRDIGTVKLAGSSTLISGTFTVKGAGADIYNTADAFHYVYQPFSGDGTITARVSGIQNTNSWAKAGVMFRESLAANSKFADLVISYSSGAAFQYRSSTGASAAGKTVTGKTAPYWVKLVRSGNLFSGYISKDGITWSFVSSKSISMADNIYVGLAVTSHNVNKLTTATFNNVSIAAPARSSTVAPAPTTTATTPSTTPLPLSALFSTATITPTDPNKLDPISSMVLA